MEYNSYRLNTLVLSHAADMVRLRAKYVGAPSLHIVHGIPDIWFKIDLGLMNPGKNLHLTVENRYLNFA